MKAFAVIGLVMLAAFPAFAGDKPRLVTGSLAAGQPPLAATELRAEMFSTGGFSLGAVTSQTATPSEPPRLGGYAAYSFDAMRLSSSIKGDGTGTGADLTASYAGPVMGMDATAALTLGYERARPLAFSPNPMQTGLIGAETRPSDDLSVSLSFTHSVSPAMSLGGFAAATRSDEDESSHSGFKLGAGLGVKF